MSTAWGPRISAKATGASINLPGGVETVVAVIDGLATTMVSDQVVIFGQIGISGDGMATAVTLAVYRGEDQTGTLVGSAVYTSADIAGAQNSFIVGGVDELGPGVLDDTYAITANVTAAGNASATDPGFVAAVVY
jgi:hypothetical protein